MIVCSCYTGEPLRKGIFFFNDPAPPEISPLSLRAALPIFSAADAERGYGDGGRAAFIEALPEYAEHLPQRLIRFMDSVRHDDTTVAAILRRGWHPGLDE